MKLPRRTLLHLTAGAIAVPAVARLAWAQAYPARPVRLLIGFSAGGLGDIVARLMGQWLSERLGQQFIVENRTGAASNVAADALVRSAPDGYTLLMSSTVNAINATVYDNLGFNFIRDTTPIASIIGTPLVMMVHPSFPAKTAPDFITHAKVNPGKLNYGSAGSGSLSHVVTELLKMTTDIKLVHVSYRGGDAPAITDLLGGHLQVYFGTLPASIEYVRAGNLRALAVTSATRSPALPDIPALGEFLPGFEASVLWNGLNAPGNTPAEIVGKLNREINAGLADPKLNARLAELGATALPGSPTDYAKLVVDETEKWGKVVRAANIKAV
jgi:tripartite-type tricarboxylate transporter receptor subunit TctC